MFPVNVLIVRQLLLAKPQAAPVEQHLLLLAEIPSEEVLPVYILQRTDKVLLVPHLQAVPRSRLPIPQRAGI